MKQHGAKSAARQAEPNAVLELLPAEKVRCGRCI
jgi:hypothetical protein